MKKSEMIILLAEDLAENHGLDFLTDYPEVVAKDILDLLESKGMLPPPTETDVITDYLVYCYYPKVSGDNTDQLDIVNSQLWEPENEEK